MKKLMAYLEKLIAEGFFGTVTLSFQSGNLCNIKVERSLKPTDLDEQLSGYPVGRSKWEPEN